MNHQWNELQQVGTDYNDLAEIANYDARMATCRDVDGENKALLATLNLPEKASVLEIGCGTGRFALAALDAGLRVTTVDISAKMLEYVQQKATEKGHPLAATQHAGFLTMDFPAATFDAVVSSFALHHLPDVWKQVALERVHSVLAPAGQFLLQDVVFSTDADRRPHEAFEDFLSGFPDAMRPEVSRHIATEYSTFAWIMEGLLTRSGFNLLSSTYQEKSVAIYHCQKSGVAER